MIDLPAAAATGNKENNNNNNNSSSNDFVIRDGFPALVRPDGKGPLIDGNEPIPQHPFASYQNTLGWLQDNPNQCHLDAIQRDCATVFSARTKEDGAAYSAGCTYFVPCILKPRCALEQLALDIFRQHTKGMEGMFRPEQSGAEWWTLVIGGDDDDGDGTNNEKDHEEESGEGGRKRSVDTTAAVGKAKAETDSDDSDDDDDDEVGMHFDADYGLEAQAPDLMLHPRLATVTYLSNIGAPTLILDRKSPHPGDTDKSSLSGNVKTAWLSGPKLGKHIAFDGRLLHGAPATFFPGAPAVKPKEVSEGPAAKKRKTEETAATTKPNATDAIEKDDNGIDANHSGGLHHKRITFLVNIWLNHCPLDAEPLEEQICASLETPMKSSAGGNEGVSFDLVRGSSPSSSASPSSSSSSSPDKLQDLALTRSLNRTEEEEPAGSEETVLCNRQVTLYYNAAMRDQKAVSEKTWDGASYRIDLQDGALSIAVGDVVADDDDDSE